MARPLRFVPGKGTLVEITCRTVQARFLFRPNPEFCDVALGVLGRAQRLVPVQVCAVSALSNHLHLLLVVDDAKQVSDFMEYVGSNLAREVNRLTGWDGPVFHRRYSMIVVTEEESAQVERLKYVLAQSCKENLVERLRDWRGVHSVRALLDGEALTGHWFDRTRERAARRRDEDLDPRRFATPEVLTLSSLPCWRHLPAAVYRERVADLVDTIEQESAAERAQAGTKVLGFQAVLARHPHHRPERSVKSPAPLVHAASKAARQAFREAYKWFVAAFREAAEQFRRGDRHAVFPAGSFPPAPPFVPG